MSGNRRSRTPTIQEQTSDEPRIVVPVVPRPTQHDHDPMFRYMYRYTRERGWRAGDDRRRDEAPAQAQAGGERNEPKAEEPSRQYRQQPTGRERRRATTGERKTGACPSHARAHLHPVGGTLRSGGYPLQSRPKLYYHMRGICAWDAARNCCCCCSCCCCSPVLCNVGHAPSSRTTDGACGTCERGPRHGATPQRRERRQGLV